MKCNLVVVSALSLLFVPPLFAQDGTLLTPPPLATDVNQPTSVMGPYDFRKTRWSMTKDEVRQSEDIIPAQDREGLLGYYVEVYGKKASLSYVFESNKLKSANYCLAIEHSNKNEFISDYMDVKNKLIVDYGMPAQDTVLWKSEQYKKDVEKWGLAVSNGNSIFYAAWNTATTQIMEMLRGRNSEIELCIIYGDLKDIDVAKEHKDAEDLE